MAINAYIGIPGSGKTYEVVHSVILPAFLTGRRIVTNIVGISQDKFVNYVELLNSKRKEDEQIELEELGEIVLVSDDDVLLSHFFPYKGSKDEDTIAKNGDLICIDEVWRIFNEAKKIKDEHKSFLAEHRHFVNEKGNTSDLVVISQSVSNIPKFIKNRIENTFKMTKLKSIGLNQRYRIDVYESAKTFKTNLIHSIHSRYNPDIFELYKSYDSDNAKEQAIDGRTNLLKSRSFIFKILFSFLFFIVGLFYMYNYFYGSKIEKQEQSIQEEKNKKAIINEKNKRGEYKNDKLKIENASLSSKWRVVGSLERKGKKLIILSDGNYLRYEPSSNFIYNGNRLAGLIDGEKVTIYSGNKRKDLVFGMEVKSEN